MGISKHIHKAGTKSWSRHACFDLRTSFPARSDLMEPENRECSTLHLQLQSSPRFSACNSFVIPCNSLRYNSIYGSILSAIDRLRVGVKKLDVCWQYLLICWRRQMCRHSGRNCIFCCQNLISLDREQIEGRILDGLKGNMLQNKQKSLTTAFSPLFHSENRQKLGNFYKKCLGTCILRI